MVRRSTDAPRGVVDTINAQRANLAELTRAQGRGTTALRDASGNVLQMNPDARYPLLTAATSDSSVAFTPEGVVKIMSPDTEQDRDMTVRDIASSGNVQANGFHATGDGYFTHALTADHIIAGNGADFGGGTVHGGVANFGQVNVGNGQVNCWQLNTGVGPIYVGPINSASQVNSGKITTYDLTANDNIAGGGLFASVGVWSPAYNPAASRRDRKTHVRPLTEYLGRSACEVVDALDVCAWQYDPEKAPTYADGVDRVSFMVDDLEQVAPQLVIPRDPAHAEAESGSEDTDDTYNMITMLNVALAAIKEQGQAIAELKSRVAALERDMPSPIA